MAVSVSLLNLLRQTDTQRFCNYAFVKTILFLLVCVFIGAIGYFLFPYVLRSVAATLVFTFAMFGLMCYLNVTMMEERRLSMTRDTEMQSKLH